MPETVKVTLEISGPIKRATFDREAVADPAAEAINDILHWSWSTRLQIQRLGASFKAEFKGWGGLRRIRARRRFSATSYDEHMLLVAAGNLDRALRRAPKPIREKAEVTETSRRALWLLRHIYEHWDELRASYRSAAGPLRGAAAKLKAEFPKAEPWSFTFDIRTGDVVIADVVALRPLWSELRLVEARVLRLERARKVPGRPSPTPPREDQP